MTRTWMIIPAMWLAGAGCGPRSEEPTPARATSTPPAVVADEIGPFTIHEWGLFAATVSSSRVEVATAAAPPEPVGAATESFGAGGLGLTGTGVGGGKPVIYVHLDEGTAATALTISIDPSPGRFVEAFPSPLASPTTLGFTRLRATRGRCPSPTPPPTGDSASCANVEDGFCEAVEVPRYHGDDDVCLTRDGVSSELLFYRASDLDEAQLPLRLVRNGEELALRRVQRTEVVGPILIVERDAERRVTIRRLESNDASGRLDSLPGTVISGADARAAWLAHATAGGLSAAEAEAFVDAWAPALFEASTRPGPSALGRVPSALREADRSILYFAPAASVDRMLPMRSTPRARATSRVFLVRYADVGLGHLGGGSSLGAFAPQRVVVERTVSTHGGVAPDVVRRVVMRNVGVLRHCYLQAAARAPTLEGRAELRLTIRTDGSVERAELGRSTIRDESLGFCVANASRRFRFPEAPQETTASIPLTFTIAPDPAR